MEATPLSAFKITGTRIDAFVGKGITDVVIPDGITETFVHPALESDELKSIVPPWEQRVWEYMQNM